MQVPQSPSQRPTEEPRSPCGSQGLQASCDPLEASGCSREFPKCPLQLRPLPEYGQGAAEAAAAALGSMWDISFTLFRDVAGALDTATAAVEVRPLAWLCLSPLHRAPPSLQEPAPTHTGHPWDNLQPSEEIPSWTNHLSK
ncbi:hypothetical protein TURU_128104 [Turdus rufiventris]|nr:hypothetical protein TURU_128104 [Turdus rufiventris]